MSSSLARRLRASHAHNLATLRRAPLAELSGSLGDLGTLLPLLAALTLARSVSLPATLLFGGAANLLVGAASGLPLPVQPMKAVAAVALARGFGAEETAAAGIVVGGVVGLLAVSGGIAWVGGWVPAPVVKGIQVGAGLSLCLSAGAGLLGGEGMSWLGPRWCDNLLWAAGAFALLLVGMAVPRVPYALVVTVLGVVLAVVDVHVSRREEGGGSGAVRTDVPVLRPSLGTFVDAALTASLGQLPLTLLNSIIAVPSLSLALLPDRPAPGLAPLGLSVAAMNFVGPWFGAMPACHGSGGLAGQVRFGAKSGASVMILGLGKILLGIACLTAQGGEAVELVLTRFPRSLLGVMVLAAGVELAKVGETVNEVDAGDLWEEARGDSQISGKRSRALSREEKKERWTVMIVTVAGLLAFRNDAIGFIAGMLWHHGIIASKKWQRRLEGNSRLIEDETSVLLQREH